MSTHQHLTSILADCAGGIDAADLIERRRSSSRLATPPVRTRAAANIGALSLPVAGPPRPVFSLPASAPAVSRRRRGESPLRWLARFVCLVFLLVTVVCAATQISAVVEAGGLPRNASAAASRPAPNGPPLVSVWADRIAASRPVQTVAGSLAASSRDGSLQTLRQAGWLATHPAEAISNDLNDAFSTQMDAVLP